MQRSKIISLNFLNLYLKNLETRGGGLLENIGGYSPGGRTQGIIVNAQGLTIKVNSFANPFPFQKMKIKSFIHDFYAATGNEKLNEQFTLHPFEINVLNKEQTLMEKLVSLIRFSFAENAVENISQKIRHFYDLYFLMADKECSAFIRSAEFKKRLNETLKHADHFLTNPMAGRKNHLLIRL